MRKSIILAVVLMVALVAVPAFASVQNVKVSGSVDSTFLVRDNFDLGANIASDSNQNLFITQTTVQVDADLTDQVSVTVGLINERVWGNDVTDADDTDIELNLAYVTLREMLYSPLTVVVGRQAFSYGNSFIIDSAGTNNVAPAESGLNNVAEDLTKQTALDAVRLIFDYNPLTLEVLYAKVDSKTNTLVDIDDDIDLYGANATYELGDDLNTQIEGYFFVQTDKSTKNLSTPDTGAKSDVIYVPGLRASADVLDGLNIQGEVAWQKGNKVIGTAGGDNLERDAFAAQVISNYQIPNDVLPDALERFSPALQYVYTYVSGDSNPEDVVSSTQASSNKWTAWDPMFENQGGGTIYNSLFDLSNANIHTVSLTVDTLEDVSTKLSWTGIWLDKELDSGDTVALVQPDGDTTTFMAYKTNETALGYEIDLNTTYDYTEDVQFGVTSGWFVPGDVFTSANDDVAKQFMLHANVNF